MKTKSIITKSIVRKTTVVASFFSLFLFAASANLAGPEGGLQGGVSAIAPTREKTILEQTQADRQPFGEDNAQSSLLRAAPGGGGNGQKQEVPVSEGICALIGLAVVYGIARRKSKKDWIILGMIILCFVQSVSGQQ